MNRFAFASIIFAAAALPGMPALAQEPNCADPQTQADMTICAGKDYQKADAELNEVWAEAMAGAKENDLLGGADDGRPAYEEALRSAQRAWIGFRDAHCAYAGYAARGGSMEPMLVNQCLARLTEERTMQLRQLIQEMGTQ
ncbi:MAG: DUF1311 domain-containing protein [Nitratireductor sp.]|nr:DUF1311 domain-containing protein [Nitratireductor sp.]